MSPEASTCRRESGETLVEVTMSILVMGIVFVALMAGFATTIGISVIHKHQATEQTIARDFGEYLQYSNDVPYQACGSVSDYGSAVTKFATTYTLPDGSTPLTGATPRYVLAINSVSYWDGSTAPAAFVSTCGTDKGAQRFNFTVTTPQEARAVETLQVVKRK